MLAAGAWCDLSRVAAGARPLGLRPLRRTIAVCRLPVGRPLDPDGPLVSDAAHTWYFKPEGPNVLCSPADETPSEPCDARPDEPDVAFAIERVNAATTLACVRWSRRGPVCGRSLPTACPWSARTPTSRGCGGWPARGLRHPDRAGDGPLPGRPAGDRVLPTTWSRSGSGRRLGAGSVPPSPTMTAGSVESQTGPMQPMTLTDEQREFRAVVRQFAEDKLAPLAAETDGKAEYSWPAFEALRSMELTALSFPEDVRRRRAPTSSPRPSWSRSWPASTPRPASCSSSRSSG